MSRAGVVRFLETATERELDQPLLALLRQHNFFDIHLTHGPTEFGKDFIAKRVDGVRTRQYAFQSKAGDMTLSGWREVRPQLVEAFENDLSHPDFDETLARAVVLVFSGRFKGNAPLEAQQFKRRVESDTSSFLVWDLDWLANEFSEALALLAGNDESSLVWQQVSASDGDRDVELRTRSWSELKPERRASAVIDCSLVCKRYREIGRVDLAALAGIGLVRAGLSWGAAEDSQIAHRAGLDAFANGAVDVLNSVEMIPDNELAAATVSVVTAVTYPAMVLRAAELASVGFVLQQEDEDFMADGPELAPLLLRLHSNQPGIRRPIWDEHSVSVASIAVATALTDVDIAYEYVRDVAQWVLDRYDPEPAGVGLAGLDEPLPMIPARLIGGTFMSSPERRQASYLATVLLDLCIHLGARELFQSLVDNLVAIQVTPSLTTADELRAHWRRGGEQVWMEPNPGFDRERFERFHRGNEPVDSAGTSMLLALLTRSRHYPSIWPRPS